MNTGKTLFAQLMEFLRWSTFDRIVARYDGNRAVRRLPCAVQYQVMAFAQLTYRESLRDIEACLSAQSAKLYHMGLPSVPTMMRHRPPGSLALRVLKDHLVHAHGSHAHRRRDWCCRERRP
jgi:hypothetical protein